jgi:hypothetical protein
MVTRPSQDNLRNIRMQNLDATLTQLGSFQWKDNVVDIASLPST